MSVRKQTHRGSIPGSGSGPPATDVVLHDPGLREASALARLLPSGIVLLDASQRCCYASHTACELLGAPDETALRDRWDSIRPHLRLGDLAGLDARWPLQRRVDLPLPAGTRPLRIEVQPLGGDACGSYVMLVRDRGRLGPDDRTYVMAGEALANRHVLAGFVHEARGPLNNFQLTLALLRSAMAGIDPPALPEATLARVSRYLEVLRTEAARLSDCMNDIHASSLPHDAIGEPLDLCVLVRDVARLLRHDAHAREARIAIDVPPDPAWVAGDARQLKLALLGFTTPVLDATSAGGVLTLHVQATADARMLQVSIAADAGTLPARFETEMLRLIGASESEYPLAIAGRLIIEAHGGEVAADESGDAVIIVTLPALAHSKAL